MTTATAVLAIAISAAAFPTTPLSRIALGASFPFLRPRFPATLIGFWPLARSGFALLHLRTSLLLLNLRRRTFHTLRLIVLAHRRIARLVTVVPASQFALLLHPGIPVAGILPLIDR